MNPKPHSVGTNDGAALRGRIELHVSAERHADEPGTYFVAIKRLERGLAELLVVCREPEAQFVGAVDGHQAPERSRQHAAAVVVKDFVVEVATFGRFRPQADHDGSAAAQHRVELGRHVRRRVRHVA
jgi:hypothetical protein